MTRTIVLACALAASIVGVAFSWTAVRQEREFRRLIAVGDAAAAQDQTHLAIEAFSGALALKDDSMLAYLKRGDTYRRRGELNAALRDLRAAASLDPAATRPLELLGDVNVAMGRYERAAQLYGRFIGIDDRSPRVLYKLALARYRSGDVASAIEPLRQALQFDDRLTEAHYLLGLCLRDRRQTGDALRSLHRALQLNPAFGPAREELADLYVTLGRRRDAIEQLEALAALESARPERLVSVGLAYARLGRPEAAILTLGRAAERHPHEQAVYTALGRVWLDMAESRSDKVALAKAVEALQPGALRANATSETLSLYGRALFLSGDFAGADRILAQAVDRPPVAPDAHRYRAAAAERLGRLADARDSLRRYQALSGTERADVAEQIAALDSRLNRAFRGGVERVP